MPDRDDQAAAENDALEHALDILIASVEGDLRFDDQSVRLKFVHDPGSGRLVASVPVAALQAAEHVLFLPLEGPDALQLLVSPEQIEEGALTDRWLTYHGEPEHVRWASFWIDGGRHGPWVFDGEALTSANPAAREEPALCRVANADRVALARVCKRSADVDMADPVCVGVDPRGIHVRARFGVVRVRFGTEGESAGDVHAALTRLLGGPAPGRG